tara:strand:- start:449 stop:1084 length:636 start_codon:yes stop_codon:yes gene_type:complete
MTSRLKLDWCSHEAAKYAVEKWHYSKTMPAGKLTKIGVWEDGRFVGCVIFGHGANNNIGSPVGFKQLEVCELVRISLAKHETPVSRIGAIAMRMLRKHSPRLKLVVSYADPAQGHYGGIYQAMGWCYVGRSQPQRRLLVGGKFVHKRAASSKWGTTSPEAISVATGLTAKYGPLEWKYVYWLSLRNDNKNKLRGMKMPYPKRDVIPCEMSK